ncbi:GntR family transcriptional regulator [Frankia sp. CNm7]|uniref:GntR family transcriptional regulator n=1 Tax=Frankia nepalensis TaxID=1836974 RepID=A0A937UQH7_9ACTN|nr:GntR family transcriptional regulator [Frankia nepalensis]MBL7499485.1 GntR family transcriptional regulator [Frankia nepalensis]MBL7515360.1 GntR family transcriptional regulator [Frankia nepalensis]MBL7523077.1 GntR family transcriptional regulator [Frankia nepalensis]MBL7631859.1 GntR family transcriptional regulator [Frankia nepalensis]
MPSAAEAASDYIRSLIFRGVLRAGDRIPIDQIAEALGVSRQPVREALITMINDDLVVAEPKRGTFVGAVGPETVLEHFELFGALAARSIAHLAATADDAVLARLRAMHAELDVISAAGDVTATSRALLEFQRHVHHLAATPRLSMLLRSMQRFVPGEVYIATVPAGVEINREFRLALLDAVERRDPDAAAAAVQAQMRASGRHFCEELRRRGVFAAPADSPARPPNGTDPT